jgi:hypothetical protein
MYNTHKRMTGISCIEFLPFSSAALKQTRPLCLSEENAATTFCFIGLTLRPCTTQDCIELADDGISSFTSPFLPFHNIQREIYGGH